MTSEKRRDEEGSPPREDFEGLVQEHHGLVFNLAYRLLGERAAAEDLTQEVFLKVHQGLDGFRGDSSLRTWIYRITLNAASNQRKKWGRRGRRRHMSLQAEAYEDGPPRGELLEDERPGPERRARSGEIADRVQEALEALPEEFREAVVLRDIEGLSYREIGQALEIPPGTVKSRIGRGRALLRDVLDDLTEGG